MSIFESSYLIRCIDKIDLSSKKDTLQNLFTDSVAGKCTGTCLNWVQKTIQKYTENSLFIKYIDYLILANLIVLLMAITFCPTSILGLLVITAFGLTVLKWFLVPGEKHNLTIFDIPVAAYIAVALISVAFSSYFMPSLKGLSKLIIYFASYVVCVNIFKGQSWKIILIMIVIAFSGSLEALFGIYQKFTGIEALATWQDPDSIMAENMMNRVYGSLLPYNPNLLAGYLLPVLPCAIGVGSWLLLKKRWLWSLIFYGMSFATLACIVFTGSRGAYLGVVAIAITVYLAMGHIIWKDCNQIKYSKYLKLGWLFAGIAVVLIAILAVMAMPAVHDRIMTMFTFRGNSSNSFRMNVYTASFKMFQDNWLIGIGLGNTTFRLVYGLYMLTGFDALGTYSVPLEIAVEMGIAGLIAFMWLFIVVFSNGIKTFNSTKSMETKIIIATIIASFMGIGGQAIVDTIWYRPQVHIIFWLLVAMLACIVNNKVKFAKDEQD